MLPSYTRVLVTTDFSELANRAIPYACALAGQGGAVHLLHVIEHVETPNPLYAHYTPDKLARPEERAKVVAEVAERLRGLVPAEAASLNLTVEAHAALHAQVPDGVRTEAERLGVDAIVLCSHGRTGLTHLLLGSVAEQVLHGCHVPVLIVPPRRAA